MLKNAIIDGAEKIENVCSTDIVSRNLPSFLKERNRLQKLHIDGTEFYANNKGSKSFKGKSLQNWPSQTEFQAHTFP